MTPESKAKETYLRITSYAPYEEMNGIPRATIESYIAKALAEYAQDQAILFFQWNANKVAEYMDYLNRVSKAEGNTEKEKQLNHFENGTIQDRYTQFIEKQ